MYIRTAHQSDLDRIMEIYDIARQFMRDSGNPSQWVGGHPNRELLADDIVKGQAYVCVEQDRVCGVFAFILGEDPTYGYIEGSWLNEEPYGTIHRIASDGTVKGVVPCSVEFCSQKIDNIRIDTHEDNKPMQHVLNREGFTRCGIIYLANGAPRIAFQKIVK